MGWNHGNFYGTETLSGIKNLNFLDSRNGEVVEEQFQLKSKKLITGPGKSEVIPEELLVISNYQLIDFEHDSGQYYTLFRIPYEEIMSFEYADDQKQSVRIHVGDNRGSIVRKLGFYADEIYEILKQKTSS